MSDQESNPKSRREVWLSVALAVARDGMPEPETVSVHDDIVALNLDNHADVRTWCEHLNFDDMRINSQNGGLYGYGHLHGWSWHVHCHQPDRPADGELARQVAAAILLPDAEVSA